MILYFKEKHELQGEVTQFVFTPSEPITWEPGQYVHYTLPHENPDDRGIERWFTISTVPSDKDITFTTRIASKNSSSFKQALLLLEPGDEIEADAPEGDFTLDDPLKDYIFVAGGIGITPFRAILAELDRESAAPRITLLYANRTTDTIAFKDELEKIAERHDGIRIKYFLGDIHIDKTALEEAVATMRNPFYYVSGPEPMTEAFKKLLTVEMNIAEDRTKFDYFPGYEGV